jgi:uncharacterized membrane protein
VTTLLDQYRPTSAPIDRMMQSRAEVLHTLRPEIQRQARRTVGSIIVGVLIVAVLIGCGKQYVDEWRDEHRATGNAIAQAQAHNHIAAQQTEQARKAAKGWVKRLIANVGEILGVQATTLEKAAESHSAEAKAHAAIVDDLSARLEKKNADYDQLYNSTGAKAERFVRRMAWWIAGYFFIAIVLRVVGLLATGPLGAVAAMVSTGMMGPIQILWSLLDNVWWRRARPTVGAV